MDVACVVRLFLKIILLSFAFHPILILFNLPQIIEKQEVLVVLSGSDNLDLGRANSFLSFFSFYYQNKEEEFRHTVATKALLRVQFLLTFFGGRGGRARSFGFTK